MRSKVCEAFEFSLLRMEVVEAKKSGWVYPNMKQVNLRGYQVSSITEAIAQLPAKGSSSIVRPRKYRVQGEFYPPHRYQEALENPDRQKHVFKKLPETLRKIIPLSQEYRSFEIGRAS